MALGVLGAGVVQLLWLIFSIKRAGVKLRIKRPEKTVRITKLFKLMGPGVLGAGVMHVNLFVDLIIASMLAEGAISYLYYADRLNQLAAGDGRDCGGDGAPADVVQGTGGSKMKAQAQSLFNRALRDLLIIGASCGGGALCDS